MDYRARWRWGRMIEQTATVLVVDDDASMRTALGNRVFYGGQSVGRPLRCPERVAVDLQLPDHDPVYLHATPHWPQPRLRRAGADPSGGPGMVVAPDRGGELGAARGYAPTFDGFGRSSDRHQQLQAPIEA